MAGADDLGSRLRRLRVERGLAQGDLAGPGLSASYVSLIEAGKRVPGPAALRRLADALGVGIEHLRDGVSEADAAEAELRCAWVELALGNGEAEEACTRTSDLLAAGPLPARLRWRVGLLHARALEAQGRLEEALEELEERRAQAEREPGRWPVLPVVLALCRCYREAGDLAHSIAVAEDALARVRALALSDTDEHVEVTSTLVASYYERGDLTRAALLGRELVERTARGGSRRAQAAAYWNASVVTYERGDVGEALRLAERALMALSETEQTRNLARLRLMYAGLLLRCTPSEPVRALALLRQVVPALEEFGSEVDRAYADTEVARASLQVGDAGTAAAVARAALQRLGDAPRLERTQALLVLAQALRAQGAHEQAAAAARQAAQLLGLSQNGRRAAQAWHDLAEMLEQLGHRDEALRTYRRALAAVGVRTAERDTQAAPVVDGG